MNLITIKSLTFIWMYAIPIFLVVFVYFCIEQNFDKNDVNYSSVWCQQRLTDSTLCKFTNVCYDPKVSSFLFFLSNLSVIRGLSHYHDLQTIQLSSVNLHNKFQANISIINSNYYPVESVKNIKKALLFSRFKPDNIMHIIHDDLIPVFFTLQEICLGDMILCENNYHLIFHDNYNKGPYFDLYKMLTNFEPAFLSVTSEVLCFDEIHMGIVQDSVFYQYGFEKVHGPIKNSKITANDISHFSDFIGKKLEIETDEFDKTDIVLISRKISRKIMNEESLIKMLETAWKQHNLNQTCKVVVLDLFQNKTNAVIKAVRQASMLVGMHGAEMILSIFLRHNSTVIELFPFGIQPHIVSYVKALSEVAGIHFNYINWQNRFRNQSVFHPEADFLHGGINHLPKLVQDKIRQTEKVPAVQCCNDPTYLYFMYQDTWVDPSFEEFLTYELVKKMSDSQPDHVFDKWSFPDVVRNVVCLYNQLPGYLNLSWTKPFNMEGESLSYDIFVLGQLNFKTNIVTESTSLIVNVSTEKKSPKFQVWISAVMKRTNARSKDVYIECTI